MTPVLLKHRRIVFVSSVSDPSVSASSTDVMMANLLTGFSEIAVESVFVALVDSPDEVESVERLYAPLCDTFFCVVKPRMNFSKCVPRGFRGLSISFLMLFKRMWAKAQVPRLKIDPETVVVSHGPSAASLVVGRAIASRASGAQYIQFWSDPIALSAIDPDSLGWRRYPLVLLERILLHQADRIVYGTRPLMKYQQRLYKSAASRMTYADVAYSASSAEFGVTDREPPRFGYVGSANARYRNIVPLLEAFDCDSPTRLTVCGTLIPRPDVKPGSRIVFHAVLPLDRVEAIEQDVDVFVCLLNSVGVQIPGKTFYNAASARPILIVLDGRHVEEMKEYLQSFGRFEFCLNNSEAIRAAVRRIVVSDYDRSRAHRVPSPSEMAQMVVGEQ